MSSVIRTLVFIIPISYGCSSEKDFAGGTNSRIASKSEQQEDADSNDIDNIDDLNLACSRSVKSTKKLISYPNNTEECPWGEGDNSNKKNGKMTARIVQEEIVTLPEGSIICAAKVKSTISSIRYDDHLVFTLNEYLSSRQLTPVLKIPKKACHYMIGWTIEINNYQTAKYA